MSAALCPDLWQACVAPCEHYEGPRKGEMRYGEPPVPDGYTPAGPWEPVAPTGAGGTLWRRPLVKVPR